MLSTKSSSDLVGTFVLSITFRFSDAVMKLGRDLELAGAMDIRVKRTCEIGVKWGLY